MLRDPGCDNAPVSGQGVVEAKHEAIKLQSTDTSPRTQVVLRPYQREAVSNAARAMANGKRPVTYSPTGSGKTEIAKAVADAYTQRGEAVLFVANRIELITQTSARFLAAGLDHGVVQAENTRRWYEQVVVCSVQTLMRPGPMRNALIERAGLIIIDECHAVPGSRQYRELLKLAKGHVCGLTATPFTNALGCQFDELIVAAEIPELIRDGFLVDVDVFAPPEKPDLARVRTVRGDYHEGELGEAMNRATLVGNVVEHWLRLADGKQTILFAVNIAHSKNLVEQFQRRGIRAGHIDAYTPDEERRQIIDAFKAGGITVLSNVGVLAEGFDCPAAAVMVLARPTRSLVRYIQMAGRVLRPHAGKERALILDHSDTVRRLGFPTDPLPLQLDDGKAVLRGKRRKRFERDEAALPRECPSCGYLKARSVHRCPHCGFAPVPRSSVTEAKGSLVALRRGGDRVNEHELLIRVKRIYAEFLCWTRSRGWKDGAAWHKTIEFFGDEHIVRRALRGRLPPPAEPSVFTRNWLKSRTIAFARARESIHAR